MSAPGGSTAASSDQPAERGWGAAAGAVLRALVWRPWLWPVAAVTVLRLARRGWWHHWPLLPLPPRGYWAFRLTTAYGTPGVTPGAGDGSSGRPPVPSADDVVAYLRWCRRVNTLDG